MPDKNKPPPDTSRVAPETLDGTAGARPTVTNREGVVAAREDTATLREGIAGSREDAAGLREGVVGSRENAADLREETSRLREEAVRAREEAAHARSQLEELMAQVREANAQLVVGSVRAQAIADDAEQANHLKDEFLATVSHELRTPLNAILGWARMLGSKQLTSVRADHAIATIERNAAALAHLIDDLLDVSRIVAGTLQLTPQPVDLVTVVETALEAVQPLAAAKHVTLELSPALPAVVTVRGDAGRLQQVIWNLLANAIKFTPEGGRVDVFIERATAHMEVRVVDTGEGMTQEFLPHVFERFRQADGASTRPHAGLGIGLAIVRQLVELHGGTVHADSRGLGHGATFSVRLPVAASEEPPVDPPDLLGERRSVASRVSRTPVQQLQDLRILLVSDHADGRTLTTVMLTEAGASVIAVGSVREALQALDAERPDVLISDIGLPDEDGYGLIRRVRESEAEHGGFLPALALTGYVRAEDRARILAAGFQAHVPKPVDPVELTAAIATIIQQPRVGES